MARLELFPPTQNVFYGVKWCVIRIYEIASFPDNRTRSRGRNGALLDFLKSRRFPTTERFLGGETVRYRDLAKTGLFPTTERVLSLFPTTPTTATPYTGAGARLGELEGARDTGNGRGWPRRAA